MERTVVKPQETTVAPLTRYTYTSCYNSVVNSEQSLKQGVGFSLRI